MFFEGEAARDEARLLATMALARESTVTEEFMDPAEVDVRCFWLPLWLRVARKGGLYSYSDADTNESSEEVSSYSCLAGGCG